MTVEFRTETITSRWLDPGAPPVEQSLAVEWRTDPLTGDLAMLISNRPVRMPEPDFDALVAKSLDRPCPFCPENIERAASIFRPDFVPEGRLRAGRTMLFPNIVPWVPDSAVAVFSPVHFARPADFAEDDLVNGLRACREYFGRLARHKPQIEHYFVGWNYLPPACSSQLHPHMQAFASETPLRQHRELLQASRAYYKRDHHSYWVDFTVEEKARNERYVGASGSTEWFTSFAGRSWLLDVLAIFPYRASILDLTDDDLRGFCRGLGGVFKYMTARNYFSFNLALYSGLPGDESLWTHARLVQRSVWGPLDQSDTGVFQALQSSYIMLRRPEDVCQELRPYLLMESPPVREGQ